MLADGAVAAGHDVVWRGVVADERDAIAGELRAAVRRRRGRSRALDRRHGLRAARRHAGGHAGDARAPEPGHRPGAARRRARARSRTGCSRAASRARAGARSSSPSRAARRPARRAGPCSRRCSSTPSRCCAPSRASIRTGARMSAIAMPARRFASLVHIEHTVFALPYAYVGAILAVSGWPGLRRHVLDHGRDGRRALVRDGRQPPDRRGDRRAQPAHREARAAGRAFSAARRSSCSPLASLARVRRRRLAARPDHALARGRSWSSRW